jgi:hypothetical protein
MWTIRLFILKLALDFLFLPQSKGQGSQSSYTQYAYYTVNAAGQPYPNPPGYANGVGSYALFNGPKGIISNEMGNALFVIDTANQVIRQVNPTTFDVTLFAGDVVVYSPPKNGIGTKETFNIPTVGAFSKNGTFLYISDSSSNKIRQIQVSNALVSNFVGRCASQN